MFSWLMFSIARCVSRSAAIVALFASGVGVAAAAPATDEQGFVDSTARCSSPNVAVAFGNTATSRVAICKTPDGQYEYRGVRLSDGAKLIVAASQSGDGVFVADNDGIRYTVTSSSLEVSAGSRTIREEPMVFFHGAQTPVPAATNPGPGPAPATTTPTTSLPPPLPAEIGGGRR